MPAGFSNRVCQLGFTPAAHTTRCTATPSRLKHMQTLRRWPASNWSRIDTATNVASLPAGSAQQRSLLSSGPRPGTGLKMRFDILKQRVLKANLALVDAGLVVLTWGNASGMRPRCRASWRSSPAVCPMLHCCDEKIVVLELPNRRNCRRRSGRPSSDTPTHLHLYREFSTLRRRDSHPLAARHGIRAGTARYPLLSEPRMLTTFTAIFPSPANWPRGSRD